MPAILKTAAARRATRRRIDPHAALAAADPVMGRLIRAAGPCRLGQPPAASDPWAALRTPFEALARSIAHQQLNGVAASRILERLRALFGSQQFPSPGQLLAVEAQALREAGFSFAKIAALKDLAARTLAGEVPDSAGLAPLSDLQIIEQLTQVRGIGRWTVEMLLIFHLRRPDVLPVDDFGVRNGFRLAYGLRELPLPRALAAFGERWKPHRSMAAWYLWRAVELSREGRLPRCARPPRIAVRRAAPKPQRKAARRPPARRLSRASRSGA